MNTEQAWSRWRITGFSVAFLLLVMSIMYRDTVLYLIRLWNQLEIGEYGHGYLVVGISMYLILSKRRVLSDLTPCPNSWALLAIVAASLLWTLAALVDVQMLQTVGLLMLLLAILWTVLGSRVTWKLLFPILFIGFAIPIWFPLSPLLQDMTADAVFRVIRLLEIPALRQENRIVLPAGSLSIEEACSGLRYLLAALTLGTLYAYLNYQSLRARLVVVMISAGAAVLTNLVRVFVVVYLGYATDMQHPWVADHLSLGWYLFGGVVVILLVLDVWLRPQIKHADTAGVAAVKRTSSTFCNIKMLHQAGIVVAAAVLAAAGPSAVYWVKHGPHADKPGRLEFALPSGTGGWAGPTDSDDDWTPQYHGAISWKQSYKKEGARVTVYIAYYPVQKQGEEVINDLNRISNEGVWRPRYPRARSRETNDGPVLEQLLEKVGAPRRLVWYRYWVAGFPTTKRYEAKALQVLGLVMGRRQAAMVAAAVDTGDDIDNARNVLSEFLSTMETPLATLADRRLPLTKLY